MNGLIKSSALLAGVVLGFACSGDDTSGTHASTNAGTGGSSVPAAVGGGTGGASVTTVAGTGATPAPRAGAAAPAGSKAPPPPPPPAGTGAPPLVQSGAAAPAPAAGSGMPAMPPPAPNGPPMPSMGCSSTMPPPPSGNMSIDVDGTKRDYIIKVPANYDAKKPYKLVFAWHGLGGTAMQIAGGFGGGYYGLAQRSGDSTIFIAGQGLPTGSMGMEGGAGWPNTGGRDVAFVRKLVDWTTTNYCIDRSRIFSVGMSYGGIMSNTLGCQMGDVFRAIAPMSGSGPRAFGGAQCVNHVAAWLSHGNTDTVVQFSAGEGSRDHWVQANHCMMQTMPTEPSPCVAYQGCDAGYPVTWCEFDGGHTVPPFAADAIFKFFSQF